MFATGVLSNIIVLILMVAAILYTLNVKDAARPPKIRMIPAFEHLKEAVDRSAELGTPIVCTAGAMASMRNPQYSDQTICNMNILQYLCEMSVQAGAHVISYVTNDPELITVTEQMMREGYLKAGASTVEPDIRVIMSAGSHAWEMAMSMEIVRQKCGAYISIGPHATSVIDPIEASASVGTMIITGTLRTDSLSFMLPASDYCFIGEECFVGSALATKDPEQAYSIKSLDIIKGACIAGSLILIVAGVFGQYSTLTKLLGV